MKKRKERKQRQLLLLLLLLVGTGLFLGTATYAWFTANKTVTVNPIDVNVAAKSGLQISADGQNWKSILTNEDITGASSNYSAAINQIPQTIEPVSTIGQVNANGRLNMYLGTVSANDTGDWILSSSQSVETNSSGASSTGSFVAYDLFLKTEATTQIYITSLSGIKFANETDKGIKNATRVAFVNLGHTTSDDTIAHIQALNSGTSSAVTIWEPNYDTHTSYGVANARDVYNITSITAGADNTALAYDGVKSEFAATENVTLPTANKTSFSSYFDTVTPTLRTKYGFDTNQSFVELQAGVTKFRVYMWIEGQDVDCENNASGDTITFDLQFTTDES